MASISRLQPGQVVYSVERQKMGNTTVKRGVLYEVRISEIDPDGRWVLASRNCNPVRKYFLNSITKWLVKKPEPKGTVLGMSSY